MTIRNSIRLRLEALRKPPDAVPLRPTLNDRARAGINWLMVSVIINILRLVLWMLDERKKEE